MPKAKPRQKKQKNRPAAMRWITRMDYLRTRGWWVRLWDRGAVLAQQLFSDGVHGGKRKALVAAQAWRDAQAAHFARRLALTPAGRRFHRTDRRNIAGLTGVSPAVDRRSRRAVVSAWRATYPKGEGEGQRYERFSVAEMGYEAAFYQAVKARCQAVGIPVPGDLDPPTERRVLRRLGER